jgi:hypothetical protein
LSPSSAKGAVVSLLGSSFHRIDGRHSRVAIEEAEAMKRYTLPFTYAITLMSLAALAVPGPKPLFSLTVAAPKEPLKAGTELILSVTVTNTSDRNISFITSPGLVPEDGFLYEIDVRDAQGRSAPPSAYLRNRDPRISIYKGSMTHRTLKPGESFVDEVTVTGFYDLSQPGEYKISVARSMPPYQNLGKGRVKSNVITVTLTK